MFYQYAMALDQQGVEPKAKKPKKRQLDEDWCGPDQQEPSMCAHHCRLCFLDLFGLAGHSRKRSEDRRGMSWQCPEPEFTYKEYKVVGTVPLQSHWHFLLLCCCHFLNSLPRLSGRPAFEPETLLK
eukprot:s3074_g5.t2